MTKEIISCEKAFKIFLKYAWKVLVAISAIVTIIALIVKNPSAVFITIYIVSVLLLTIIVSLILVINDLIKREIADKTNLDIPSQLVEIVFKLSKAHASILIPAVDRILHLMGKPDWREKMGEKLDNGIEQQVIKLIDNWGWAKYQKGREDIKMVISNISRGVQQATENGLWYYAAKGERHLAGIARHQNRIRGDDSWDSHIRKAEEYKNLITNETKKAEIEGSIYFAKAKYFLENENNLTTAEENIKKAEELFANDNERQIKVFFVKGDILFKQENWFEAYNAYHTGYVKSENVRNDERAKNAFGLAKICLETESSYYNIGNAKVFLIEANELSYSLKTHERDKISGLLDKINQYKWDE